MMMPAAHLIRHRHRRRRTARRPAVTTTTWSAAVERVIDLMHQRARGRPPSLREMADTAYFSPYHFHRLFCRLTGVPPGRFLSAVRLATAKRLLVESGLRVTDVCFEVGYESLGTFTTQFTQAVGVSPNRLRRLTATLAGSSARLDPVELMPPDRRHGPTISGHVQTPDNAAALICLGLFAAPLPQGRPRTCALLTGPGEYQLVAPADGTYHLFAAALRWPDGARGAGAADTAPLWVGASPGPLHVRGRQVSGCTDVALRPRQRTDPPIVVSLPSLLAERLPGLSRPAAWADALGR